MVSVKDALIATVRSSALSIAPAATLRAILSFPLPPDFARQCRFIKWSTNITPELRDVRTDSETISGHSYRILLADDCNVRVYDTSDPLWKSTISNANGGAGRIAYTAFGWSHDHILVFSEFGIKLTIWSLTTRKGVEVRDPKHTSSACYSYRRKSGHLAILTRPAAQDVLVVLSPDANTVVTTTEIGTIDAQEVEWSQDGHWFAIRDAPSFGSKILIYTAHGCLFRTWSEQQEDDADLGALCLRWNQAPNLLAIGHSNDSVSLLGKDQV